MSEDFDLLVIGGALAGLTAANRGLELGQRVAVLEAASEPSHACASRVNSGCFHVAFRGLANDPDVLVEALEGITHGFTDPQLASLIGHNATRSVRWLAAAGVEFKPISPTVEWKQDVFAPYGGFQESTTYIWKGWGADLALDVLERRVSKLGGRVLRGTKLVELTMEHGRCCGAVGEGADGRVSYRAKAVVLADGGFEGNPDMLRRFISPNPENVTLRGVAAAKGDGIRLAEAAGAKLIGMEAFYGHVLSADSLKREGLNPFPFLEFLASVGMMLDGKGERFVDETAGGHFTSNVLARHGNGLATVIFDDAMWNTTGTHFLCPPNPSLVKAGGTLHRADDFETLAKMAGLAPAVLRRQAEMHNAKVDARKAATASSSENRSKLTPFTQGKYQPERFEKPPYYAAPACAGLTYTFGGVAINDQAQVLNNDGDVIEGLLAAGSTCGGIEGGPHVGYMGGLIKASVLGLAASEGFAKRNGSRAA